MTAPPVSSATTNDTKPEDVAPISQSSQNDKVLVKKKAGMYFLRDMPKRQIEPPDPNFQLLPPDKLKEVLAKAPPHVAKEIEEDVAYLNQELLRFFKDRDYEAKKQQNRYRSYQIMFILLALGASCLGAAQALVSGKADHLLPFVAFGETAIALIATFVSTISTFEPPMPRYIHNRRIAESLRQEYFRYLMRVEPYDQFGSNVADRKMHLSRRAAEINQGKSPDVQSAQVTYQTSTNEFRRVDAPPASTPPPDTSDDTTPPTTPDTTGGAG